MLKRNGYRWCLICFLLFSLTACAKKKPLETTATTTTETTTQTMLLTTEGAAVTTTEATLPVTEGIEVTTTTETGTTTTERTTLSEEQRTTVICSLPTTIPCTVTTTELPHATTTRLTGPDTVVTAPLMSGNPSTTTTTAPTTAVSFDTARKLQITVNGETVRLSFDHEEVRYVHKNGETDRYGEYHYVGVSPTGVKVQCAVIPSENVIADIRCDLPLGEPGEMLPLSEVRAFVVEELCRMGFAVSDEQITSAGNILDKQFPHRIPTYSHAIVQLSENEYISVTVVKKGDALCVLDFYARKMQKERDFIISEAYPYLVPNWV